MKYTYTVKMVVTDIDGCDALEVKMEVPNAHSFSEALVLAERNLTYKQGIIKVLEIMRN